VKTNHKIVAMACKKVQCESENGEREYHGDAVICALGLKSNRALLEQLRAECKGIEIIPVGDVNSPRKIMQATHEGFHAARRI
ncbi:MAG: hypothetical protein GX091_09880, partial [Peptococcaceae bacterium]|nr:hypothetical protein [Peptococcaceae bacterium]